MVARVPSLLPNNTSERSRTRSKGKPQQLQRERERERMASAAEAEAVDFEPEEDDLMDEDGGMEAEPSPHAPLPKLKSAITGGSFSGPDLAAPPKKTKGRGFREESDAAADRNKRFADKDFDSLFSDGGPGPQRCQFRFLSLPLSFFSFISNF